MRALERFLRSDEATTAVEYAVMLALIAASCIAAIKIVGDSSSGIWAKNKSEMDAVGF